MNRINYNDISLLISRLLQDSLDGQVVNIDEESVKKATNIVIFLHPKNTDEVFLQLCALNLLNAAIKTETFKDYLSYDLIKTNAAKLITNIDGLKNNDVSYYYKKDEDCLYFELGGIVFSFHHVPSTSEILKASFANPIIWPGKRLQRIAQPLLNSALVLFEDNVEIKSILEKQTQDIEENKVKHEIDSSYDNEEQSINTRKDESALSIDYSNALINMTNEERNIVAKKILSVVSQYCKPDSEGWFDLVKIAPKLKANGINYNHYGYHKLILFLEAVFGDSMQRRNTDNTVVYLRFPLDDIQIPADSTNNKRNDKGNQDNIDFFEGVRLGDNVEISTYGLLKKGKISILNKQFVQLELKDNRSIRIRRDAILSIESIFSPQSNNPIDLSFANAILKDVLVAEGLYTSSTIETNATITMVESRRVWLTTDDGNTGSCYKGAIIGYDKEKLVKGQRIFVFPFKKEKAFCVIMEMSYYELYELFENLLSSSKKGSGYKRTHILSLLTFIIKNINHTESLQRVRELKKQLKSLLDSSNTSMDDGIEEDINSDEAEMDPSHDISNEGTTPSVDVDNDKKSSVEDNNQKDTSLTPTEKTIFKPETPISIQVPKVIKTIDLSEIERPKKKKEEKVEDTVAIDSRDSISINSNDDLLPSMGRIIRMGPVYGWITPHDQEENLYFNTAELISYSGIIDAPSVGDEVVFSLSKNTQGPIAVCVHKQCAPEVVEELIEKYHFNTKTSSFLKKHIEGFNNQSDDIESLAYYLKKVGIDPKTSFSPNDVEKQFAEILTPTEYAIAIEYLIDEVAKNDSSKCYNLFLRSSSYARSHKMYDVSRHLIKKALKIFKGESGKVRYFKGLLKTIDTLSNRIEINENTLAESLEISRHTFPFIPIYVRDIILTNKDFNGITPDKETIITGLYKEEYIEELKNNIKQNNADDLLYLTMMKLQLAFHPKEYNPKDDISKFLVNRAKNILATGDEHRYSDVRYLLRLAYSVKTIDNGFDYTVGLYLMTLGDYSASEIEMYMNKGDRSDYKFEDLLKNVLAREVDNTLELTLLAESNVDIKNRIIREYEKNGKNADGFDEYPTILNEVKKRFIQYSANPLLNFRSFISYLQSSAILLINEMNIIENDSDKIVSFVTDFNTGQKYNVILNEYNNIIQKIDAIIPNLISHPSEIGYETVLPALRLLKKDVHNKFVEIEQRVNPTITIDILESVGLVDTNTTELKVEIRNSGDSARAVHINRLNVHGKDLIEDNNINIDYRLSAGEEKLINIELHLCDNAVEEKIAEVEFEIGYDDIYIATDQRISKNSKIPKTINFEIRSFVEIENKFRQCAGGEELEPGSPMFYGRSKIIGDIQEAILAGTKNQIAIYGQKRSGKSSLLNQIIDRLESDEQHNVICGKFNLQGLPSDELAPVRWILREIAISLLRGIRKRGVKGLSKATIESFFRVDSDDFAALREFVEHINTIDELHDYHLVIFIDEFTYLYQLIKVGKIKDDFMRRWIALIETPGINLQTIVAAQDTLPHFMKESYASNCFNKFSKEPLSYLSKEEALQLIKNPIKGVIFHNHSDEIIYDYTSGSAYFTQIFCSKLVDYLNLEKNTNVVGKEEIETVADRLCTGTHRLESSIFECLTKEADGSDINEEDNRKVLRAIAKRTRAGGYANIEDLDIGFSQEHLKIVLNNLYERRVVSKQEEGYSINVKLFVRWILNN